MTKYYKHAFPKKRNSMRNKQKQTAYFKCLDRNSFLNNTYTVVFTLKTQDVSKYMSLTQK